MPPPTDEIHRVRAYRAYIDGLRAVAILTVVGSHALVPGFYGGYVGVDVFFVISGYLIINQIIEDLKTGRFSILEFYTRRAFRILPAFLLVMVTCLFVSTTIFVQPEHKDFANSFFLSAVMAANHHFLSHQGYFDMAAFTKPLLHMWSLAVEEQFYLVTPLLLLGLTAWTARLGRNRGRGVWTIVTVALGAASFAACVAFTFPLGRPNVSFYIMPTRGWEFILGGSAPFFATALRRLPASAAQALAAAGAGLIVFAVVLYDADTLYPSYRAAAPAVGAALIIAAGLVHPGNAVARVLASAPMVGIGLVSYSWYLWHWPLISFVRTMNFGELSVGGAFGAAALSLVLAILTYRYVETPTRALHKRHYPPARIVGLGFAACLFVAGTGYLWALHVAPRWLPELRGLEAEKPAPRDYPRVAHRGALVGDSHAYVLRDSLAQLARQSGARVEMIARAGCPPLLGIVVKEGNGQVASYCEPFFERIAFDGAEFAILVARWNFYLGLPPSDPYYRSFRLADKQSAGEAADPYGLLAKGLAATLSEARRAGVRRILVIGPSPEFPWYAPYCVMRDIRVGVDACRIPRAGVEARRRETMAVLRAAIAPFESVRLIDPIDIYCSASECRPNAERTLFFSDLTHLSPAGAERLYAAFRSDFLWVLSGEPGKIGAQLSD